LVESPNHRISPEFELFDPKHNHNHLQNTLYYRSR
jgi:hypothetical protein